MKSLLMKPWHPLKGVLREKRMIDVMKPEQRKKAMAHNRGRTKPEKKLASALWKSGLRYFTGDGYKSVTGIRLPGHPDLVFPRKRVAIFVDGCFWHGCPQCKGIPTQSGEFWKKKIMGNTKRDALVTTKLQDNGWRVLRVWEHELTKSAMDETIKKLRKKLSSFTFYRRLTTSFTSPKSHPAIKGRRKYGK